MTNEEILKYLARCNCPSCVDNRKKEEKSLEELHLDNIFNGIRKNLATDMMNELKQNQAKFIQFFEQSIREAAEKILHEAFDSSCAYGFSKMDMEKSIFNIRGK